jgi:hypothetical protein
VHAQDDLLALHEDFEMIPHAKHNSYQVTHPAYGVHLTDSGLGVLHNAAVPAVLIETHFIGNPTDAARYRDPAHLAKVHRGLELGLLNFFAWQDGRLHTESERADATWTIQVKATEDAKVAADIVRKLKARGFPDVRVEYMYVDNAAMQLVTRPGGIWRTTA